MNHLAEIENPFGKHTELEKKALANTISGYERNDLNQDYFTHHIIRAELASITSVPVPNPTEWCFRPDNDSLFSNDGKQRTLAPETWVKKGEKGIRKQLAQATRSWPVAEEGGAVVAEPLDMTDSAQEK